MKKLWGWLLELDQILRGEVTRLADLKDGSIKISVGGITLVLVLLGMLYGLCMAVFALINDANRMQLILRVYYGPLIRKNKNHRWMLRAWLVVYAFVGIQMGWVLRPFIGDPALPVQFFRADSWGNAYVIVSRMFWKLLFPNRARHCQSAQGRQAPSAQPMVGCPGNQAREGECRTGPESRHQ